MGFFSRRRKRRARSRVAERAALGSFASAEGQPVVGQQVGGGEPARSTSQGLDVGDALARR